MLVVGVAHDAGAGDDLLIILDPSGDVLQIEPSELNRMGHWQETWFVAA